MEEENKEIKSFKDLGLDELLVEAFEKMGWKNPKEIQLKAIPQALQGKDVIGFSQTGSGKTGAFALPILHALLDAPRHGFFACVISPTRFDTSIRHCRFSIHIIQFYIRLIFNVPLSGLPIDPTS